MKTRAGMWTLLAALAAAGAGAEQNVEERRAAPRDGMVDIENWAGTVTVTAWDRAEVLVKGELGGRAEGLRVSSRGPRTVIEVESDGDPHRSRARLDISVPAGSSLRVETFAAVISVGGVKGPIEAETVEGSISIKGSGEQVQAEAVNGSVEVEGRGRQVKAESVNGSVTVRGGGGHLEASTVNGSVRVEGGTFEAATLETVSGDVQFAGALAARGSLRAESVSGSVELKLPASTGATFSVSTFSGEVVNELGPPAERTSRHTPEKELRFTTGDGSATVDVDTHSGSVALRK